LVVLVWLSVPAQVIDLQRLVSKVTHTVLMRTLNPTHSVDVMCYFSQRICYLRRWLQMQHSSWQTLGLRKRRTHLSHWRRHATRHTMSASTVPCYSHKCVVNRASLVVVILLLQFLFLLSIYDDYVLKLDPRTLIHLV